MILLPKLRISYLNFVPHHFQRTRYSVRLEIVVCMQAIYILLVTVLIKDHTYLAAILMKIMKV